jgi:outer membrane receptor protein involved in Fe transport
MNNGHFRLDARLWNQDRTETYVDAEDSSKKIYERETKAEDDNWSVKGEAAYKLSDHKIEFGGETRRNGWGEQTVNYIDESYFNGSINFMKFIKDGFKGQTGIIQYHALYLQDTWAIHPDISMEFGLRQEWFKADSIDPDAFGYEWSAEVTDISDSHLDPRFALTWLPWNGASITARWGIAHRYPTSPEYFWWYLNNATDYFNTDLNPEEAVQYELAWEQSLKGIIDFFVRGYYYDIDDYISSTSVSGIGSVYFNIGQVTIKGIETGFSAKLPWNFRLWSNFTWQDGDKSDDPWDVDNQVSNELPDFPEYMANAGLDYTYKKFKAKLWLNHVDEREHFDGEALETLDAYTLTNISATWRLLEKKTVSMDFELTGENILDEDYEEESGYPMADATIMAGIRLIF